MEIERFDRVARLWASGTSRRTLLGLLSGTVPVLTTLTAAEARKKRRGKGKKKRRDQQPSPSPPPPASPPSGCAAGNKPCKGGCIPDQNCCANAECAIADQACTSSGRCQCPGNRPEVCNNTCVPRCESGQTRRPDCSCCTINGVSTLNPASCCSGTANGNGMCVGHAAGAACTFNDACASANCVQEFCSPCAVTENFCSSGSACGIGGGCLKAVDGTTRCGIPLMNFTCGLCTRDLDCDQGQGLGYFCAQNTGSMCPCPGETFCARP